jgi:hypothetical protein
VGRIGYLNELEKVYELGFGFKPDHADEMLDKVKELAASDHLKAEWTKKRARMLKDKINVAALFTWFFENYPHSIQDKDKYLKE